MRSSIIPAPASIIVFIICLAILPTLWGIGYVLDIFEPFAALSSCCILLFYLFFCRRFFTRLIKAANITDEDTISYYSVMQNIEEHLFQWLTGIAMGVFAVLMLNTDNITKHVLAGMMFFSTGCFFVSYFGFLWREQRFTSETEKLNRAKSNRTLLLLLLTFAELIILTISTIL